MHRAALWRLVEKAPAGSSVPVQRETLMELLRVDDFNASAPNENQIGTAILWYNHFRNNPPDQSPRSIATCWLRAWVKVRMGEEPPVKEDKG